jgi:threonine/homoserine/homoserine lactone efflux protein
MEPLPMNLIDAHFPSFLLVTLLLTISPGVDTFLVIRNVLRGGKKDGLLTSLGICSGLYVHAALSACGISMLLVQSSVLFQATKIIGAGYLCWLGGTTLWNAWRRGEMAGGTAVPNPGERGSTSSFREGFLSNLLNPKPAVFFLALLPQFLRATDPVFVKSMFLASVQFTFGLVWLTLLAVFVERSSRVLRNASIKKAIDTINGSFLIAFGMGLLFERRQ